MTVCWLGNGGKNGGMSERENTYPLVQNIQTSSGTHQVSYSLNPWVISRCKLGGREVNTFVPTLPVLRISAVRRGEDLKVVTSQLE